MKASGRKAGLFLLTVLFIVGMISGAALAANRTFTGTVGDAMCGAKHVMPGNDVSCTRGCISKGSKYALLIGDKVYALETTDKAMLDALDKRSGEKVTVTGTETGNTITVTSVKAAE